MINELNKFYGYFSDLIKNQNKQNENESNLVESNNQNDKIDEHLSKFLQDQSIKKLDISFEQINIKITSFSNQIKIQLEQLKFLEILMINNHKLQSLDNFPILQNLKRLELNNNQLTINEVLKINCPNLISLSLIQNDISYKQIDDNVGKLSSQFSNLKQINMLNICKNLQNLIKYKEKMFDNFPNLIQWQNQILDNMRKNWSKSLIISPENRGHELQSFKEENSLVSKKIKKEL